MTEMLRDGTVVWKMTFPPGDYLGRATYLTDNLYTPATALHQ
jgi:hypothetical protein